MKITNLKTLSAGIILFASMLTGTANAGLIDRGNGLIYDDVLDVTWLQNADLSGESMNWNNAVAWADSLVYSGFNDWRLTQVYDQGNDGCTVRRGPLANADCEYDVDTSFTDGNGDTFFSELAYMFHVNLGNISYRNRYGVEGQVGWDSLNTSFIDAESNQQVSFINLRRFEYFSGTEFAANTSRAWHFDTSTGRQASYGKVGRTYVWAVRDGDVVAQDAVDAPEPSTIALFGLGLLGLTLRARKLRR